MLFHVISMPISYAFSVQVRKLFQTMDASGDGTINLEAAKNSISVVTDKDGLRDSAFIIGTIWVVMFLWWCTVRFGVICGELEKST